MTTGNKITIKQAEISVNRFQERSGYQLGLLRNLRSNIEKSLAFSDWNKIKREEMNATRVIKQLKNLLLEMDSVREKVRDEDLEEFDALLKIEKDKVFNGMSEYLELQLKSPTSTIRSQITDDDDDDENSEQYSRPNQMGTMMANQSTIPLIECNFQPEEFQLQQRQACLEEHEHLQTEIRTLYKSFQVVYQVTHQQGESVQTIADNAEEALENVHEGANNLRRALTYKKAMYPVVGALLGTCVGGPIGLVAGLKAGGLAAVGCGILGFTGGSVLKNNQTVVGNINEQQIVAENQENNQEVMELEKKNE